MNARALFAVAATTVVVANAAAPSCQTAGQQDLCKDTCSSTCRGFPPGFGSPGCIDDTDCQNPPAWAAGSVCECGAGPTPAPPAPAPTGGGMVGGYLLLRDIGELQVLAKSAATIPFTRIYLAFLNPTLSYQPGSKTLAHTGLDAFAWDDVYAATQQLVQGGVEVFLSMGGWNAGCFPYFYARYSVGGYGTSTPNFWEIQQYGGGDVNNCVESNQFCWVCEPPSEHTTLDAFNLFPEPKGHATWEAAKAYVSGKAGDPAPIWNEDMAPGAPYTDSKTGISVTAPGTPLVSGRNPYQDFVYLAKDMGVTGIDLDYEEMWHADYFKTDANPRRKNNNSSSTKGADDAHAADELFRLSSRPRGENGEYSGPWLLHQTVYKYAAIAADIQSNINAIAPALKLGTAAAAVGAWTGDWWGGNLKGLWAEASTKFPEVIRGMAINVMTYDLSKNENFHECPDDQDCPLDKQVGFYMSHFKQAGIPASVGYEIGTPAYPNPVHDAQDQLPLTKDMLASIISTVQSQHPTGGFLWEIFKAVADPSQATPQDVAQAVCASVRPGDKRCTGTIPPAPPSKNSNATKLATTYVRNKPRPQLVY